jgi:hypothetical protein
MSTEDIP